MGTGRNPGRTRCRHRHLARESCLVAVDADIPTTGGRVMSALTNRQREGLYWGCARDMTYEEVARQLYIAVGTVKGHAQNINTRLDVQSMHGACYHYGKYGIDP